MRGDQAAGLRALLELLLQPLLLLRLLSQAAALQPGELFPYGQFQGDQLLNEGDDESSAAVKLASPLRFYGAQFSYLYVSSFPSGCGTPHISRSFFPGTHVVWISPNPCLRRRGNSVHALLSRSAPGVGPGFAAMLLPNPRLFLTSSERAITVQGHTSVPDRKEGRVAIAARGVCS